MDLSKVLEGKTPAQQVTTLKSRRNCAPAPNVKKLSSQYNPDGHKINDRIYRPDKAIKEERTIIVGGEKKTEKITVRTEEVNRAVIALQKKIVSTAVSFLFANPVTLSTSRDKKSTEILKILDLIFTKNKINSFNRRLARAVFSYKEAAEYWYPVTLSNPGNEYGFESKHKLRSVIWSPGKGDELYPLFDEHGDMIAFSRQYYTDDEQGKEHAYFDTYTAAYFLHYEKAGGGQWEQIGEVIKNPIGKIPVVYVSQEQSEWEDVQPLIERLEKALSNAGDTNDYHSSPKIFVNGRVKGWSKKGESGAVIEGEKDTKAEYLSWDHAPEGVKFEFDVLLRLIYSLTQTPDISFESVKGLGNISGIALKLLFMDAHLKCYDKIETFEDVVIRRLSIVRSYIGVMNNGLKKSVEEVNIKPKFTPFMIDDKKEWVETLVSANGGRPVVSQKRSVELADMSNDPEEDYKQILEEKEKEQTYDVFGQGM